MRTRPPPPRRRGGGVLLLLLLLLLITLCIAVATTSASANGDDDHDHTESQQQQQQQQPLHSIEMDDSMLSLLKDLGSELFLDADGNLDLTRLQTLGLNAFKDASGNLDLGKIHVQLGEDDVLEADPGSISMDVSDKSEVFIREKPFFGPGNDPELARKRWGEGDAWKHIDPVVNLDDANFEHLTQAASGWTTGDWFILFGAPWCRHCQEMRGHWNHTARDLYKSGINVAYMDASACQFTAQRFEIFQFPTVLLLRQGRSYEYPQTAPRIWRNYVLFARKGFEDVESREIRPAHGTFDEMVVQMQEYSASVIHLYETRPNLLFGSVFFALVFGFAIPYYYVFHKFANPDWIRIPEDARRQGMMVAAAANQAPKSEVTTTPGATVVTETSPQQPPPPISDQTSADAVAPSAKPQQRAAAAAAKTTKKKPSAKNQ